MGEQLYRYFDDDDVLLYVGISISAVKRYTEHRATQLWINEVVRITIEHLGDITRQEALEIERATIEKEKPEYNRIHNRETVRARNWRRDAPTWQEVMELFPQKLLWLCDVCEQEASILALHKNDRDIYVFCFRHRMIPDDRFDFEIPCSNIPTMIEASVWSRWARRSFKRGKTMIPPTFDLRCAEAVRSHRLRFGSAIPVDEDAA